ncbi:MAG: UDP-glucose 4-epimerase (EC [uncultured Paraburkholderia sp.]|uniref:NAD-dependent epimerase/dehydratase family protein n=1 Tax=uncultured Paraburkholderia sp. TaxID=1822466 RepID=UPI0025961D66|nr:NAD(P)-dependent oxidoreductase [uncultured Paraburkholderia sp.]CAH2899048.1 MAG: UDP-glucose 4-epimerase (EC [uncultured Paraburkholderia sp.]CAH2924848.1 MAG: UDP-glucose 4-epimerase (EC [uncultured Paraburkholderia sp.]
MSQTMTQNDAAPRKPFRRLLLTGAAGNLGRQLRGALAEWADVVRVTDIASLGEPAPHEEASVVDLANREAVMQLVEGVDAIVHLGGISIDAPFDDLLGANIAGTYNLYEAARKHGVKRIAFASSNHVIGFHPVTEVLDADAPQRPDTLYGVTKCFGIETVCMRIGSSFEEPKNPRMLVTYLSYCDFIELVRCSLFTNRVGHVVVYGASDNPVKWWDNTKASFLGFNPRDSSAPFAERFPATAPDASRDDPAQRFQGGPFVLGEPLERENSR